LKERATYDRMIAHQRDEHRRGARCWNPSSVARPHRLAFAFRDDDGLNLDAKHLALVCPSKRLCDLRPGARGRIDYQRLLGEMREACLPVVDAIKSGQQIWRMCFICRASSNH
jgi:hypothetical protein